LVFETSTSTAELTVKVVAVGAGRTTPADNGPKADTLPKASVAALVPAPLERTTPAALELKTRLMVPVTVAVTESVPLAVVCATAADEIIIRAAKMVKSITFFIVFLSSIRIQKFVTAKKSYFQTKLSWP
jgi:hypothetical protein